MMNSRFLNSYFMDICNRYSWVNELCLKFFLGNKIEEMEGSIDIKILFCLLFFK